MIQTREVSRMLTETVAQYSLADFGAEVRAGSDAARAEGTAVEISLR